MCERVFVSEKERARERERESEREKERERKRKRERERERERERGSHSDGGACVLHQAIPLSLAIGQRVIDRERD